MLDFFKIHKIPNKGIPIKVQRELWFRNFIQAFIVVFGSYFCMYLIRNNFKAAQPLMVQQLGIGTFELGIIGLAFSITYGIGKTLIGYFIDGNNTKRIIAMLLILSSICVFLIGIVMATMGAATGLIMVLWGASGLLQSTGGPGSYSTITRWAPRTQRGRYLGFWNVSHNVGGALAGIFAFWGANTFFDGNVAGMFIFPAIVTIIVGFIFLFVGHDDPEEIGWNRCEEIFDEPIEEENLKAEEESKWHIFKNYVIGNPWIWMLCVANIFVYIVRIGIDNWAPLYVVQELGFSNSDAVKTIFYFEIGALFGSMTWGYVSDLFKGRRCAVAILCLLFIIFAVDMYRSATTVLMVNTALFLLGALIFGPQLLIGVSLVGFVPKNAVSVANGLTGTFGYLFGDSMAKVALGYIADPKKAGLNVFGHVFHGWEDTFVIFYIALACGIAMLALVAYGEERRIRKLRALGHH